MVTNEENLVEIKDEIKDYLKDDSRDELEVVTMEAVEVEIKDDIKDNMKDESKEIVGALTKEEVENETKDEVKDFLKDDSKDELELVTKEEVEIEKKDEIKDYMKDESKDKVEVGTKQEVEAEITDEIKDYMKDESKEVVEVVTKEEVKVESKDEIKDYIRDESKEAVEVETMEEVTIKINKEVELKYENNQDISEPTDAFSQLANNLQILIKNNQELTKNELTETGTTQSPNVPTKELQKAEPIEKIKKDVSQDKTCPDVTTDSSLRSNIIIKPIVCPAEASLPPVARQGTKQVQVPNKPRVTMPTANARLIVIQPKLEPAVKVLNASFEAKSGDIAPSQPPIEIETKTYVTPRVNHVFQSEDKEITDIALETESSILTDEQVNKILKNNNLSWIPRSDKDLKAHSSSVTKILHPVSTTPNQFLIQPRKLLKRRLPINQINLSVIGANKTGMNDSNEKTQATLIKKPRISNENLAPIKNNMNKFQQSSVKHANSRLPNETLTPIQNNMNNFQQSSVKLANARLPNENLTPIQNKTNNFQQSSIRPANARLPNENLTPIQNNMNNFQQSSIKLTNARLPNENVTPIQNHRGDQKPSSTVLANASLQNEHLATIQNNMNNFQQSSIKLGNARLPNENLTTIQNRANGRTQSQLFLANARLPNESLTPIQNHRSDQKPSLMVLANARFANKNLTPIQNRANGSTHSQILLTNVTLTNENLTPIQNHRSDQKPSLMVLTNARLPNENLAPIQNKPKGRTFNSMALSDVTLTNENLTPIQNSTSNRKRSLMVPANTTLSNGNNKIMRHSLGNMSHNQDLPINLEVVELTAEDDNEVQVLHISQVKDLTKSGVKSKQFQGSPLKKQIIVKENNMVNCYEVNDRISMLTNPLHFRKSLSIPFNTKQHKLNSNTKSHHGKMKREGNSRKFFGLGPKESLIIEQSKIELTKNPDFFPSYGPYMCEICRTFVRTSQEFVNHIRINHKDQVDEKVLDIMESHHNNNKVACLN